MLFVLLLFFLIHKSKDKGDYYTIIIPGSGTGTKTGTNTKTGSGTVTGTNTGTGTNQIILTKEIPVYYLQLSPVPHPSNSPVQNVTLPKDSDTGNILTISKVFNFGENQIFYETTQKVKYLQNPSQYGIGDYYLIKKSDI